MCNNGGQATPDLHCDGTRDGVTTLGVCCGWPAIHWGGQPPTNLTNSLNFFYFFYFFKKFILKKLKKKYVFLFFRGIVISLYKRIIILIQ
jgi:hypothetical protein